jgi:tetratricopeptide (TPR) repeat protein
MPAAPFSDAHVVATLRRRLERADAMTLSNFAWFAARRGERQAALDAARTAVGMPDAPRAAWRALECLAAGHTDGMLLATAGSDGPAAAAAINPLMAAIAAHRQMDVSVAEACYRAALAQPALLAAAWNGLGVLHEQRRERAAADHAWHEAAGRGSIAAVHNQAMAMLCRGLPHRARLLLAPSVEHAGAPIALRFLAGYAALNDQDAAAALPLLADVIAEDPDSARAQFTLGLVLERLDRHVEALAAIRRALLLSPWYMPQAWLLDPGPGAALIELVTANDESAGPTHTDDVLLSLGRALLQTSQLGEALAVFEQVLAHQPSQPAALFHRGVVLAKMQRYEEALDDWEVVGRTDRSGELGDASRRHARSARQLATLFAGR